MVGSDNGLSSIRFISSLKQILFIHMLHLDPLTSVFIQLIIVGLVTPYGDIEWINIGLGNGLLPGVTKL